MLGEHPERPCAQSCRLAPFGGAFLFLARPSLRVWLRDVGGLRQSAPPLRFPQAKLSHQRYRSLLSPRKTFIRACEEPLRFRLIHNRRTPASCQGARRIGRSNVPPVARPWRQARLAKLKRFPAITHASAVRCVLRSLSRSRSKLGPVRSRGPGHLIPTPAPPGRLARPSPLVDLLI
jgi:hypothetical protein